MATTACFIIVSRNNIPIYEAEVGSAAKREDSAQLHQFILHASLDIVQDLAWTTSAMFLKAVDRFNDLVVSVYVTAGHTRLMLLHDSRNDDGIKSFFQEVHELYIKYDPEYHPSPALRTFPLEKIYQSMYGMPLISYSANEIKYFLDYSTLSFQYENFCDSSPSFIIIFSFGFLVHC
ncbi:trafficking protein particle complex subunit 2 isoform X1 [Cucurbita maxima]|uniref:Trafficking protein particle complex subunit 2 isoform X1 n=1 Tax=Cucurbita maxima TaxID=3661 RepID=A0A6J1I468_CUCMA|nr:trafficking protein particle complex subunit 2 isoform X1 [Cucurbita maxima]